MPRAAAMQTSVGRTPCGSVKQQKAHAQRLDALNANRRPQNAKAARRAVSACCRSAAPDSVLHRFHRLVCNKCIIFSGVAERPKGGHSANHLHVPLGARCTSVDRAGADTAAGLRYVCYRDRALCPCASCLWRLLHSARGDACERGPPWPGRCFCRLGRCARHV